MHNFVHPHGFTEIHMHKCPHKQVHTHPHKLTVDLSEEMLDPTPTGKVWSTLGQNKAPGTSILYAEDAQRLPRVDRRPNRLAILLN